MAAKKSSQKPSQKSSNNKKKSEKTERWKGKGGSYLLPKDKKKDRLDEAGARPSKKKNGNKNKKKG